MIIKLSLALPSYRLQYLALPPTLSTPCLLSVLSDGVTGDSPLCIVYIIPQHSTLFACNNLNGPLLLPSLPGRTIWLFIKFFGLLCWLNDWLIGWFNPRCFGVQLDCLVIPCLLNWLIDLTLDAWTCWINCSRSPPPPGSPLNRPWPTPTWTTTTILRYKIS